MTGAEVVDSEREGGRQRLTLRAPGLARAAAPGQFVMVAVPGHPLRRPFWIAGLDADRIDLVVEVVGPVTAWLAARPVGEELDLLGPLGRPAPAATRPILVGDVTMGPLRALAQASRAEVADTPERLEAALAAGGTAVYAGSPAVLAWTAPAAARHGVPCSVAVQPPMACGTGLCWTCAVPQRDGPPVRACVDGPLLDAARVDLQAPASRPDPTALDPADVDLAVDLGPVRLANPVLAASGTAGSGLDLAGLVDARRLGAVVAKTVTLKPRAGRPGPRMVETTGGMLNAIGLQNPGVDVWLNDSLTPLQAAGVPVIASIAGESAGEYGLVASRLPAAPGLLAVEANISCPNVEDRGRVFATRRGPAAEAVAAAVAATDLPVFAKLTADVTDIAEVAAAVLDAGAAGVTVANTLSGLAIDAETRRPRLGGGTGGLSGPAVKPVALRAVAQVAAALPGVPIIGMGGVRTVTDVVEFALAGATAVAVGTASFADPRATLDLVEALPSWLAAHGHRTLTELRGRLEW